MTKESTTVPVTLSALIQRMRRRCRRDGETFHVTRGKYFNSNLGYCYTVDDSNVLAAWWWSLDALVETAREVGVLAPYEDVQ